MLSKLKSKLKRKNKEERGGNVTSFVGQRVPGMEAAQSAFSGAHHFGISSSNITTARDIHYHGLLGQLSKNVAGLIGC